VAFRNGAIQHAWEVKLTDSQGGSRVMREALGGAALDVVNVGNILSDYRQSVRYGIQSESELY
jgi:hypothetical protein